MFDWVTSVAVLMKGGQTYRRIIRDPNPEAGDDRSARATVSGERKPRGLSAGLCISGERTRRRESRAVEHAARARIGGRLLGAMHRQWIADARATYSQNAQPGAASGALPDARQSATPRSAGSTRASLPS